MIGIICLFLLILFIVSFSYKKKTQSIVTQLSKTKAELENKNKVLEFQKHELVLSLKYAHEIQKVLLPGEEFIKRYLPLSFFFYKPKDIVGGDFFWFHKINEHNYIIGCADCTGHGIPGAFMTMLGNSFLNQIVVENKIYDLSQILFEMDRLVKTTLKQNRINQTIQDGMDMAVIKIDKQNKQLHFAGAKHKSVLFKKDQIHELKGNRFGIGGVGEKTFTQTKIEYEEDDTLYLYTDGYVDQFGGENDKKFTTKQFYELLQAIHYEPILEQYKKIEFAINKWKHGFEQTDDITVIGIKF